MDEDSATPPPSGRPKMIHRGPDGSRARPWWGIGDIGYGLLVFLGSSLVAGVVVVGVVLATSHGGLRNGNIKIPTSLWVVLLSVAAGWVGFIGWPLVASRVKGFGSLKEDFGLSFKWVDLPMGVGVGLFALFGTTAIGALWKSILGSDLPSNGDELGTSHYSAAGYIVLFIFVAMITPVAEELFFRGLSMRAISKRYGAWWGIVASSILFGVLHVTTVSSLSAALVVPFIVGAYGFLFALIDSRVQRLGPSIVAHGIVNGAAVLSMALGAH